MTVIFCDCNDVDTRNLKAIWRDLDAKVIELSSKTNVSQEEIDNALAEEKDTIIICGHGSDDGCFNPEKINPGEIKSIQQLMNIDNFAISSRNAHLLKGKKVIGIWCFAAEFARKHNLEGFYSSMFISNKMEAKLFNVAVRSEDEINNSEIKFCNILNTLLKNETPLNQWKETITNNIQADSKVESFNYKGVQYF